MAAVNDNLYSSICEMSWTLTRRMQNKRSIVEDSVVPDI